jgi:hypothetical protein
MDHQTIRRGLRVVLCGVAAVACLGGAITAGVAADRQATRRPTAAELSAADAKAEAARWQREPAGKIFPATLGYISVDVNDNETATRLGISPVTGCGKAVDSTLTALAAKYRCQAGLRATYADSLQGVIYTVGVLAFPTTATASAFDTAMPPAGIPAYGLRAFPVPGTAAARFTDAAREESSAERAGSYVVFAVAGYADGRPATTASQADDTPFTPVVALADEVAQPLGQPERVDCHAAAEWSC